VGTSKRIPHAVFPKQVGKWKISKKALHLLEFALLASVGDPNDFFRIRIRILKTKNEKDVLNFSPAEAVFGSQLVLPGQFLSAPEPPSPSFLSDFQGVLAARTPLKTVHHTTPAPVSLPEDLLLSRFVLVRHDGAQPPLSPLYDGPFLVLERSLHFFKIQMGKRQETVSTHRLKPCHAPLDAQAAEPPRRGRPPAVVVPLPPPVRLRSCIANKGSMSASKRSRHVSFTLPTTTATFPSATSSPPPSPSPEEDHLRRSARPTTRPARYSR